MNEVSFPMAMIGTHFAYFLIASVSALFLRGVRKSLEHLAAGMEARIPASVGGGR